MTPTGFWVTDTRTHLIIQGDNITVTAQEILNVKHVLIVDEEPTTPWTSASSG